MSTIAELNDAFRQQGAFATVHLTAGISALPLGKQAHIMRRVMDFDAFTEGNDPYGEHDFGGFEFAGQTIFWKIDYYDRDFRFHSPNPADPAVTRRILTVLFAEEY
jgi:hypothetical protein